MNPEDYAFLPLPESPLPDGGKCDIKLKVRAETDRVVIDVPHGFGVPLVGYLEKRLEIVRAENYKQTSENTDTPEEGS